MSTTNTKEEVFYKKISDAVAVADYETHAVKSNYVTDLVNLVWRGVEKDGNALYHIYRTFDKTFKQCYQIRYTIID